MGFRLPGEVSLAEELGVSRMTVNKVMAALEREGLVRREKGRGTFIAEEQKPRFRVALSVATESLDLAFQDYYFGALYWKIRSELDRKGITLELVRLDSDLSSRGGPDFGVIAVNPPERSIDELISVVRTGASVVLLGASWSGFGFCSVDSENSLGAALAVNHLVDQGIEKVLFLGACAHDSNTQDRLKGFQIAMKGRGLIPTEEDIFIVNTAYNLPASAQEAIFDRISKGYKAVFAAGPHIAVQLLAAAAKRGLSVPKDLAIVGYDDPPFLAMVHPSLSTVRQPLEQMAEKAAAIVLERLSSQDLRPSRYIFDPELIVRDSSIGIT